MSAIFGTNHIETFMNEVTAMEIKKAHRRYLYLTLKALFSIKKLCTSIKNPQARTKHFIIKNGISKNANISKDRTIIKIFLKRLVSHIYFFKSNFSTNDRNTSTPFLRKYSLEFLCKFLLYILFRHLLKDYEVEGLLHFCTYQKRWENLLC